MDSGLAPSARPGMTIERLAQINREAVQKLTVES